MSVPSTVVLQHLPDQLKVAVEDALAEVLHPSIKQRDYVFMQDFQEVRSLEIQASCVVIVMCIIHVSVVLHVQIPTVNFTSSFLHVYSTFQRSHTLPIPCPLPGSPLIWQTHPLVYTGRSVLLIKLHSVPFNSMKWKLFFFDKYFGYPYILIYSKTPPPCTSSTCTRVLILFFRTVKCVPSSCACLCMC